VRARRGPAVERQQIKWLAYSGCLVALTLVPSVGLSLSAGIAVRMAEGALMVALLTMPAAVAVAVLRYRLYDLDIVVRKTLVAALVAAAFTAIYALAVVAAGAGPGGWPIAWCSASGPLPMRCCRSSPGRWPAPTRSRMCCRGWPRCSARRP